MAAALDINAAPEEEVFFASVREQAANDPVMGAPMGFFLNPDDETDVTWVEAGTWENYPEIVNPESRLPYNIPVQALGMESDGLTYVYFNTKGHIVRLNGNASKGIFELLFAGRNDYLYWLFPRYSKEGHIAGWDADQLKQALSRWAGWCDTFDDEDSVRGRGMWRDDKGQPVVHAGDAVFVDGEWKKPGLHDGYIYPARKATGRPRRHPDLRNAGRQIFDILRTWTWERPELDPILMLGWIATAKMGGALFRRPFAWVTGPHGSGKSYLQTFNRSLMHGALHASSNASTPSIYRKLGKDCIPVLLDEQESKADTSVTDRLLDIMRAAYTGDGLDRVGENGKTVTYNLRSSFMASSIAKPTMETSDESRMALLNQRVWEGQLGSKSYEPEEAYRMGQALSRRIVDWFPRWDALLRTIETAMASRPGHVARSLDTFAPLVAGYHLALHDGMPTEEQLKAYANLLDPAGLIELQDKVEDWEKCLRHLLGAMPETMKHTKRKTIGRVLADFVKTGGVAEEDCDEAFAGLRVSVTWRRKDGRTLDNAWFFVPNSDPQLVDLFEGTGWKGRKGNTGPWVGVLKQAPRALWTSDIVSSKGGAGSVRGVAFRLKALMDHLNRDETASEETPPAAPLSIEDEYEAWEGGER
jgi:hypothetical protein